MSAAEALHRRTGRNGHAQTKICTKIEEDIEVTRNVGFRVDDAAEAFRTRAVVGAPWPLPPPTSAAPSPSRRWSSTETSFSASSPTWTVRGPVEEDIEATLSGCDAGQGTRWRLSPGVVLPSSSCRRSPPLTPPSCPRTEETIVPVRCSPSAKLRQLLAKSDVLRQAAPAALLLSTRTFRLR